MVPLVCIEALRRAEYVILYPKVRQMYVENTLFFWFFFYTKLSSLFQFYKVKLKIAYSSLCSAMNKYRDTFISKNWLHKSCHLYIFTLKLEKTFIFLVKTQKTMG